MAVLDKDGVEYLWTLIIARLNELNNTKIIYSETEPDYIDGAIWLKPIQ